MKTQEKLKYLMEYYGISKKELADEVFISCRDMDEKLSGKREFMSEDIQRFADAFGKPIAAYIFFDIIVDY